MKTINKVIATELINKTKGRIFTVTYVKKDKSVRIMNCRLGVTKGVSGVGMAYNPATIGMKPVFDMQKKEWRMLNLLTITELKVNKETYSVV